ncbi:MAG: hypothetical protein WBM43_11275, partial [Flavobacteriaceae bacterium]
MSKQKVLSAIALCLLGSLCLSAQYTVSRCSDLGLRPMPFDPTDGTTKDLLASYLEESAAGEGIQDCWVFHHTNGKDYVVIPGDWGQNPREAVRDLIDDAMKGITDARKEYEAIGTLHNNLYYLFEGGPNPGFPAITYWLFENQCWMNSQLDGLNVGSRARARIVFAHEVAHCFNMENVKDIETYFDLNDWFDESVAEYLASEVYKDVDSEHYHSKRFNLEGKEFTQPYKAYPLWYFYARRNGKQAVVELMIALALKPSRSARLEYLRSIGFDMLYHEFLFDFHRNKLEDSSGNTHIPAKEDIEFRQDPITLVPGSVEPLKLDPIPSERMSLYEITIPERHTVTIYPPSGSSDKVYYALLNDPNSLKYWEEPVEIKAQCNQIKTFQFFASHLSGTPAENVEVKYELSEREACCDLWVEAEDNPSVDELNGDFYFDYYIESEVVSSSDGSDQTVEMKYFVNSSDGSMLLLSSFFMDNFSRTESGGMEVNGVIWFPNGQVAAYVMDKTYSQKRVITMDMNQTRSDVKGVRAWKVDEFLRVGVGSTVAPEPLPPGSQWRDNSMGYAYYQPERHDPRVRNKFTGYVSNDTSFVESPMTSFGFMVGHM